MKRRFEISFYGKPSSETHEITNLYNSDLPQCLGRAAYIYGPPCAQLDNLPGRIQLSMDGELLETIDLEEKCKERNQNPADAQILCHWESSGGDASHMLQISLLDSATGVWRWRPIRGFGLDSVVYTSEARLP
ncbi:hypothetical protein FS837_001180 [Tulasnella sp. UAMH 9824]|nr:hypothetical protein FS837_001180 [Tulasnella sp. UAMH 9824]